MEKTRHQLTDQDYFIPHWPIKYLFLGTFNPAGGDEVNYYYGRKRNQVWPLLREITGKELDLENKSAFLAELKELGIGCMDMILEVHASTDRLAFVVGKGYSDAKIINNYTQRIYNTATINTIIAQNEGVQIFSTWGKGRPLKEWKNEVLKISSIVSLVSPSMAAKVPKGIKKFEFMLADWSSKIFISKT
jgi:hypothetical protein